MKKIVLKIFDIVSIPFVVLSGFMLWAVRRISLKSLPISRKILIKIGVIPIIDHYYEPLINPKQLKNSLRNERILPGIKWNIERQLSLLKEFKYQKELENFPNNTNNELIFQYNNVAFLSGDAEYWYSLIRNKKPKNIIEIGSGQSTKLAFAAIKMNTKENPDHSCDHICIEPYESPWLENLGINVIRERVESLDVRMFSKLNENDILFIDSSHIIRPQGDVLFEYLEILPILNSGVIVHIHDIFSPRDYLDEWIKEDVKLWNEQYLLEAFLTNNNDWEIIGALNYLHHNYYKQIKEKCPKLTIDREPGSFYIQKK